MAPNSCRNPIVLLAGLSGSGKSVAAHFLEDVGFLVIDAIPASLLESVALQAAAEIPALAFTVDIRSIDPTAAMHIIAAAARSADRPLVRIWLEASESTIQHRYSETRRPHPGLVGADGDVATAVRSERRLLASLHSACPPEGRICTDGFEPTRLGQAIRMAIGLAASSPCSLVLYSFGFRHGIPLDADIVLDARGLRNPHWSVELRSRDGRDQAVSQYALGSAQATDWLAAADAIITTTLNLMTANRTRLMVAIGCTGGRHRSVAVAEALAARARARDTVVRILHRELTSSD